MIGVRTLAATLVGSAVMSMTPAELRPPAELAALDPSALAASLCSGRDRARSMPAMLAAAAAVVGPQIAPTVTLDDGLGQIAFPITTTNSLAQRYFNQGLGFAYGFNHAAAIASFRAAQQLDPRCAMCWWGEALAHGPNINAPLTPDANAQAIAAIERAGQLRARASAPERALIAALARRYSARADAVRATLDGAYADAMLAAARTYPAHDDIAVLAAEAAMDTLPWDYWEADRRTAKPRLGAAIALVERVMARNPDHPQGPHLYIHLMENGPDPKRAEAAADHLATGLARNAGHMVHMPSHIYYRLGRWKDSIAVNVAAARRDEAYIRAAGDRGLVRYGYYPHNVHFIVTSAQMAGDLPLAMREAARLTRMIDPATATQIAWIQAIYAAPFFAASQFATPTQVLAMPAPDPRLPYVGAMRHYARAVAYARQRNARGFDHEYAALRRTRQSPDIKPMIEQGVPVPDLIDLAALVARGRFASAQGRTLQAAQFYRQAIEIEQRIPYMEPPYWYYPVGQSLGGALYRAGRFDAAREAFTAALVKAPNNGWALFGLAASERALGRPLHAAAAQGALVRAWSGDPRWLRIERL